MFKIQLATQRILILPQNEKLRFNTNVNLDAT